MSDLPFDIMADVLKHLPVKSLLRFRCLSKAHCSLIDSRDFIDLHLSQSKNTNTNRSLIVAQTNYKWVNFWKKSNTKSYMMNLDSPDYQLVEFDHPLSVFCEEDTHTNYRDRSRNPVIFGSCNGLMALYHPDEGMLLWNPSTKKQHKLPNFWGPGPISDYLLDGFGYDPVSDDYKLIRIQIIHNEGEKRFRGMVYSVKHNCSRSIQDFPYSCSRVENWAALVGSCLHWIVSGDPQNIVAFNLEDERFRAVPIPDVLKHERYLLVELGEVGGCLGMCTDDEYDLLIEIWVMKEYGISESWIRIFSTYKRNLGLQDYYFGLHYVKPVGYSKTGDKLLMDVEQTGLWEYDLQKEEEKEEEEDQTSQQNPISKYYKPPYYPDKRVQEIEMDDIQIRWDYSFICLRSLVSVNI